MMEHIKDVLIERDHLSADEADERIVDAKAQMDYYMAIGDLESAENICNEFFELEPDYLIDLL